MTRALRGLAALVVMVACEDAPRPASPAVGTGTAAAPASATTPAGTATAGTAAQPAAPPRQEGDQQPEAPERELGETDFVESLQNRDPFRSYLAEIVGPRLATSEWEVLLKKHPLDELKLIAIVSGGIAPRAMFEDPGGTGVTVKRGDRVSKSEGKISKILSDRVIVEIEDTQAGKEPETIRREVLLHPEEPSE